MAAVTPTTAKGVPVTESDSSSSQPAGCASHVLRWERAICKTGTAWGLLAGAPLWALILWWLIRHAFYLGLTAILVILPDDNHELSNE